MRRILLVLGVGLGLCVTAGHAKEPVAVTLHFAFYSDFETNLNDALLNTGVDRKFGRPELFKSGAEVECFEALPGSMRTAWELAVSFYRDEISPVGFDDREQFLLRLDLSGVGELRGERDRTYVGIVRGIMRAAAPAYEACRWEAQDQANRKWIADVVALLDLHATAIAAKLARLYEQPLAGLPIRYDVVETVSWSGANTILLFPEGGHVLISIEEKGTAALELVFHEASHTLMARESPVQRALATAAEETGVELPRDLWHAVLFNTTGDAVERVLEDAGEGYRQMMFAQEGGIFGRHHGALKKAWTGYLAGTRTLAEASKDLLRAVGEAKGEEGP